MADLTMYYVPLVGAYSLLFGTALVAWTPAFCCRYSHPLVVPVSHSYIVYRWGSRCSTHVVVLYLLLLYVPSLSFEDAFFSVLSGVCAMCAPRSTARAASAKLAEQGLRVQIFDSCGLPSHSTLAPIALRRSSAEMDTLEDFVDPLSVDLRRQTQVLLDQLPDSTPDASLLDAPSHGHLLDALSDLMLVPGLTVIIAKTFRPVLMDLCARWLHNVDKMRAEKFWAFCLLLETHPELFP